MSLHFAVAAAVAVLVCCQRLHLAAPAESRPPVLSLGGTEGRRVNWTVQQLPLTNWSGHTGLTEVHDLDVVVLASPEATPISLRGWFELGWLLQLNSTQGMVIRRVSISMPCQLLLQLQQTACGIELKQQWTLQLLPGRLAVPNWTSPGMVIQGLEFSCDPAELPGVVQPTVNPAFNSSSVPPGIRWDLGLVPYDVDPTAQLPGCTQPPSRLLMPSVSARPVMACAVMQTTTWEDLARQAYDLQPWAAKVHLVITHNISLSGNYTVRNNGTIWVYRDLIMAAAPGHPFPTLLGLGYTRSQGFWSVSTAGGQVTFHDLLFTMLPIGPKKVVPIAVFTWSMWCVYMDSCKQIGHPWVSVINCIIMMSVESLEYMSYWTRQLLSPFPEERNAASWYGVDTICQPGTRHPVFLWQNVTYLAAKTWFTSYHSTAYGVEYINTTLTSVYDPKSDIAANISRLTGATPGIPGTAADAAAPTPPHAAGAAPAATPGTATDAGASQPDFITFAYKHIYRQHNHIRLPTLFEVPYLPFINITWISDVPDLIHALSNASVQPHLALLTNLSIPQTAWPPGGINLTRSVFIAGWISSAILLDFQGAANVIRVPPGLSITFRQLSVLNAGPTVIKLEDNYTDPFQLYQGHIHREPSSSIILQSVTLLLPLPELQHVISSTTHVAQYVTRVNASADPLIVPFTPPGTPVALCETVTADSITANDLTLAAAPPEDSNQLPFPTLPTPPHPRLAPLITLDTHSDSAPKNAQKRRVKLAVGIAISLGVAALFCVSVFVWWRSKVSKVPGGSPGSKDSSPTDTLTSPSDSNETRPSSHHSFAFFQPPSRTSTGQPGSVVMFLTGSQPPSRDLPTSPLLVMSPSSVGSRTSGSGAVAAGAGAGPSGGGDGGGGSGEEDEDEDEEWDSFDMPPDMEDQLLINTLDVSSDLKKCILGSGSNDVAASLQDMVKQMQDEMGSQEVVIERVIGQGGGGVVYQGTWRGLTVAVKILQFSVTPTGDMSKQHRRAITEAALCKTLQHPNIVATYAYDLQCQAAQSSSTLNLHSSAPSSQNLDAALLDVAGANPDAALLDVAGANLDAALLDVAGANPDDLLIVGDESGHDLTTGSAGHHMLQGPAAEAPPITPLETVLMGVPVTEPFLVPPVSPPVECRPLSNWPGSRSPPTGGVHHVSSHVGSLVSSHAGSQASGGEDRPRQLPIDSTAAAHVGGVTGGRSGSDGGGSGSGTARVSSLHSVAASSAHAGGGVGYAGGGLMHVSGSRQLSVEMPEVPDIARPTQVTISSSDSSMVGHHHHHQPRSGPLTTCTTSTSPLLGHVGSTLAGHAVSGATVCAPMDPFETSGTVSATTVATITTTTSIPGSTSVAVAVPPQRQVLSSDPDYQHQQHQHGQSYALDTQQEQDESIPITSLYMRPPPPPLSPSSGTVTPCPSPARSSLGAVSPGMSSPTNTTPGMSSPTNTTVGLSPPGAPPSPTQLYSPGGTAAPPSPTQLYSPAAPSLSRASSQTMSYTAAAMGLPHRPRHFKLFIIQEFCDGGTLRSAIDSGKLHDETSGHQVPVMSHVLQLACDIAAGLAHIHSRSVVHGDLAPGNVLLRTQPGAESGYVAKVSDFGLSWRLPAAGKDYINVRQGTSFYIAPEVLHVGIMSKAADLFSFGMILHEMYHGTPPWRQRGGGPAAGEDQPPVLQSLYQAGSKLHWDPACPARFKELIMKCLDNKPNRRPSVHKVVEILLGLQHTSASSGLHNSSSSPATSRTPSASTGSGSGTGMSGSGSGMSGSGGSMAVTANNTCGIGDAAGEAPHQATAAAPPAAASLPSRLQTTGTGTGCVPVLAAGSDNGSDNGSDVAGLVAISQETALPVQGGAAEPWTRHDDLAQQEQQHPETQTAAAAAAEMSAGVLAAGGSRASGHAGEKDDGGDGGGQGREGHTQPQAARTAGAGGGRHDAAGAEAGMHREAGAEAGRCREARESRHEEGGRQVEAEAGQQSTDSASRSLHRSRTAGRSHTTGGDSCTSGRSHTTGGDSCTSGRSHTTGGDSCTGGSRSSSNQSVASAHLPTLHTLHSSAAPLHHVRHVHTASRGTSVPNLAVVGAVHRLLRGSGAERRVRKPLTAGVLRERDLRELVLARRMQPAGGSRFPGVPVAGRLHRVLGDSQSSPEKSSGSGSGGSGSGSGSVVSGSGSGGSSADKLPAKRSSSSGAAGGGGGGDVGAGRSQMQRSSSLGREGRSRTGAGSSSGVGNSSATSSDDGSTGAGT